MPYVSLELEMRPLAAAGLIFHLGQALATPYMQLKVLTEQVSRAVVRGSPFLHCGL
jgi:laminin alpha 3/5